MFECECVCVFKRHSVEACCRSPMFLRHPGRAVAGKVYVSCSSRDQHQNEADLFLTVLVLFGLKWITLHPGTLPRTNLLIMQLELGETSVPPLCQAWSVSNVLLHQRAAQLSRHNANSFYRAKNEYWVQFLVALTLAVEESRTSHFFLSDACFDFAGFRKYAKTSLLSPLRIGMQKPRG